MRASCRQTPWPGSGRSRRKRGRLPRGQANAEAGLPVSAFLLCAGQAAAHCADVTTAKRCTGCSAPSRHSLTIFSSVNSRRSSGSRRQPSPHSFQALMKTYCRSAGRTSRVQRNSRAGCCCHAVAPRPPPIVPQRQRYCAGRGGHAPLFPAPYGETGPEKPAAGPRARRTAPPAEQRLNRRSAARRAGQVLSGAPIATWAIPPPPAWHGTTRSRIFPAAAGPSP